MTDERKASDVLLSIEGDVKMLSKSISSLTLAHTLILDKVNKIYSYINKLEMELAEETAKLTHQVPGIQNISNEPVANLADTFVEIDNDPVGKRRVDRTATTEISSEVVSEPQQEKKKIGGSKVPVVQRITDEKGKDLFMADVRIADMDNQVISKIKTNAVGKWQALLPPGQYDVFITKTDVETKNKLEAKQRITVSNTNSTMTLPVAAIKKPQ